MIISMYRKRRMQHMISINISTSNKHQQQTYFSHLTYSGANETINEDDKGRHLILMA